MAITTILPQFLALWALFNVLDIASGLPFDDVSHTIPTSGLVKREPDENCDAEKLFFERQEAVGQLDHGSQFCAAKWLKGTFPNKIEAKATKDDLRYLKIGFTDGSETEVGKSVDDDGHGRYGTVKWDPFSDTFAKFSLYEGAWKGGLGRIVLETTNNCGEDGHCKLDAGKYWDDPPPEKDIPRGGKDEGMLLGFAGAAGDVIDGLRPIFSNSRPEKVRLTDAEFSPSFEELNERPFKDRQMEAVHQSYILSNPRKDESIEMRLEIYLSVEERKALSWSNSQSNETGWELGGTIGGEVSFNVGQPVAEAKGKFEVTGKWVKKNVTTSIKSGEDTEVNKIQLRYGLKTVVKAGQKVKCTGVAIQSRADLQYKATLEQFFQGGNSFKYPVQGRFQNSLSSDAISYCEDLDDDDDDDKDASKIAVPHTQAKNEITESGTYCTDGTRVGDTGMSDEDLLKACGV